MNITFLLATILLVISLFLFGLSTQATKNRQVCKHKEGKGGWINGERREYIGSEGGYSGQIIIQYEQ